MICLAFVFVRFECGVLFEIINYGLFCVVLFSFVVLCCCLFLFVVFWGDLFCCLLMCHAFVFVCFCCVVFVCACV